MNYGDLHVEIKGPKLTSYQKDFLYNDKRFTVTEASTKVGKTFAHIWWIFERAHQPWNEEGYEHWWVAPVYGQAKIAFKRLKKKLKGKTGYNVAEGELSITCPNGAVIRFKSAKDPDALFGEDVYSVVFDEAPRAKVEAHYALRSTITATGGVYKLIGNFGGVSNWVHQLKEKAQNENSQYAYYKITAWDAVKEGILREEEILQAMEDLPTNVFNMLYLAEESESEDMLCTYASINDLWTNDYVQKGTRYITADIALHGSDIFVIAVWDGLKIIHWEEIEKCDAKEVTKKLKDLSKRFRVSRSNIAYDADGLGSFLKGYLKGAVPFVNGSTPLKVKGKAVNYKHLKAQCGFKLAEMINEGLIYFECEIDKLELMKELECLQSWELDKDGKMQLMPKKEIKSRIGHSPDRLDALLMRMIFILKPKRSVKVRIN